MGSHNIDMVLPACDRTELLRRYKARQENDREEYGSDPYNGSWSTTGTLSIHADKVFATRDEAWAFCESRAHKRENAVAVHILDKAPESPKALATMAAKLEALRTEVVDLPKSMIARAKAVKSKTRGCAKCGSSIAVAYIGQQRDGWSRPSTACPVCQSPDFLQTQADKDKLAKLSKQIADGEAALTAATDEHNRKATAQVAADKLPWFIGGWAAS